MKRADGSRGPGGWRAGRAAAGARAWERGPAVNQAALWRRLLAEFLGSAFLAAIVIGSGIAAQTAVTR